jgi:hypothetical protein
VKAPRSVLVVVAVALLRASATGGQARAEALAEASAARKHLTVIPSLVLGVATPVSDTRRFFSTAPDLGASAALTRTGSRWRFPISLSFKPDLDSSPATRIWFLSAWLHPEITLGDRFVASAGVGWSWRHIAIDGAADTPGAPSAVCHLGARFRPRPRAEITVLARYEVNRSVRSESFFVQHLGLLASFTLSRQ